MATFKPVVLKGENQKNSKGETNIKILICQHGKTAYIKTPHYINPDLMGKDGKVSKKHPNHEWINHNLKLDILKYEGKLLELKGEANRLTVHQIKDFLTEDRSKNLEFFTFAEKRINELKERNQRTWKSYSESIAQFKKFIGRPLDFNELDSKLLEEYKRTKEMTCSNSTISIHIRGVRAIFYDAVDEYNKEGLPPVIISNPFKKFKLKKEKSRNKNLSVEIIKAIRDYSPQNEYEEIARDMAMLTFYLIGINTIDLFYLPPLSGCRIEYSRKKVETRSQRFFSILAEPEIIALYEKHKGQKYFLKYADNNSLEREKAGIVMKRHQRFYFQYRDHKEFQDMINKRLQIIAKNINTKSDLNIPEVTTYFLRHSWATIASEDCNISDDIIALCLGHVDTEKEVTLGYINKSKKKIDEANRLVLNLLLK